MKQMDKKYLQFYTIFFLRIWTYSGGKEKQTYFQLLQEKGSKCNQIYFFSLKIWFSMRNFVEKLRLLKAKFIPLSPQKKGLPIPEKSEKCFLSLIYDRVFPVDPVNVDVMLSYAGLSPRF